MAGTLLPFAKAQWFTDAGSPANGYQLFVYLAGTNTKASIYSDAALATPLTNPVVLNSSGRADVFVDTGAYDLVMADDTDTDPPTSPIWETDGVTQIPPPYTGITILASGYSGAATTTTSVNVSLLNDNDGAVCEWMADYGSSTLSARATVAGVNYDLGSGAASTYTQGRLVITRLSSTTINLDLLVLQDSATTPVKMSRTSATVADLDANALTVELGMASGTYTIRDYSILHQPTA